MGQSITYDDLKIFEDSMQKCNKKVLLIGYISAIFITITMFTDLLSE